MEDRTKKAFEIAQEVIKQLLTLSTGMVGLTATFAKDLAKGVPPGALACAVVAWVLLLFSVALGALAMMCLAGELDPKVRPVPLPEPSIYRGNITFFAGLQVLFFFVALCFVVAFGVIAP